MEMLTKTAFLSETAKTTMSKLKDIPFVALSRVESTVVCPDQMEWDDRTGSCFTPSSSDPGSPRTWLGLAIGIGLLVAIGWYGDRRRRRQWVRVVEEEGDGKM